MDAVATEATTEELTSLIVLTLNISNYFDRAKMFTNERNYIEIVDTDGSKYEIHVVKTK